MPTIEEHITRSADRARKRFQEVHEWIDDKDQATMAQRHDLTRILETAASVSSIFGQEAAHEYILHICDDIENVLKLKGLLTPEICEVLALFGIKK